MTAEQHNLITMAKDLQGQLNAVIAFVESGEFREMSPRERCLWNMEWGHVHFTAGDFAIQCIAPWKYNLPETRN
jgi:hypothetical protein